MNFKQYINKNFILNKNLTISESLKYHIENNIPISNNIFRTYSEAYFDLINETRNLYNQGLIDLKNIDDIDLVESDICQTAYYNGEKVYLDAPIEEDEELNESEYKGKKVSLNKPFRTPGENKKYAVYVKNSSGNVIKVRFGDPNLKVKGNSDKRRKSFAARHKCSEKKDKTTARYWSCRSHRIKSLGNKGSGKYW